MIVVITTSILATILVLLGKLCKPVLCLKLGFAIVTFIGCIHYDYGNDYNSYYLGWNSMNSLSFFDVFSPNLTVYGRNSLELGWVLLNSLFGFDNGFYCMVAFLNLIEGVIYYKFIRRFAPKKLYFWSFATYVFTFKFYLLNFSMMRQGFAMTLVLLSFIYFCDRRFIKMALTLAAAVSVHTSALIVTPFFVLCRFVEKINVKIIAAIIVFTCVLVYIATSYTEYIFNIIISMAAFEDYKDFYTNDRAEESYGLGFVLLLIPYMTMIYFMVFKRKKISVEEKCMIVLSFVAFLLKPFEVIGAQLIARVGFYFSVFDIALVPVLYSRINNPIIRIVLYISLITITAYTYITFYDNPIFKNHFLEFHSIFDL